MNESFISYHHFSSCFFFLISFVSQSEEITARQKKRQIENSFHWRPFSSVPFFPSFSYTAHFHALTHAHPKNDNSNQTTWWTLPPATGVFFCPPFNSFPYSSLSYSDSFPSTWRRTKNTTTISKRPDENSLQRQAFSSVHLLILSRRVHFPALTRSHPYNDEKNNTTAITKRQAENAPPSTWSSPPLPPPLPLAAPYSLDSAASHDRTIFHIATKARAGISVWCGNRRKIILLARLTHVDPDMPWLTEGVSRAIS